MIRDVTLFLGYETKKAFRNPIWPMFGIMQPVLYLLMFAPLQASLFPGGTAEALRSFTPAAMMMIALFGSMFTGFSMIGDLRAGVLERLAVSPVWRPSIVLGRVLKDVLVLVAQALAVIVVATLMGLRVGIGALLLMVALMAATGLFASSLSQALALSLRDENAISQTINLFLLPVMLLSGMLIPISFAPDWMKAIAPINPLYHAVEAGRALFAGDLANTAIPVAFVVFIALSALTVTWSMRSLRHLAG